MRWFATIRIALRALRRNKLRSVLTTLGIIIGVGAVIAMVGIGNGAKAQVEAQIASLGQNVVLIFSGNFSTGGARSGWGGAGTLTIDDAAAIATEIPGVLHVSPEVRDRQQVLANGLNWNTTVLGEGPDYLTIRDWPLVDGGMFTDQDVRSTAKVCIIGQTIATELFANEDPVGQGLRIRNIPFKILGVLARKGLSVMGSDQDDVVVIPYTSAMKRVSRRTYLNSIIVQTAPAATSAKVQADIADLLRQRHRIGTGRDDDFTIRGQEEIAAAATATTKTMTALLGAIASVSLLVGGIGIMNIMLVSVTERTREIGIRMAVGAHGRDILLQFLTEAITLSSLGGILGILLGVGSAKLLSAVAGWPTLISTSSVVVAFLFSAAVGIFFGFYPARKAARLDPITALRYE
ncbi:MAG: Macrolide export ATP-binding/permease protein MacB [Verrucomicrobiae bacterium]|nr:Macrolide export ATP-binding/permease protein MacB [Verrucomicrobiae bacterium]